MLVDKVDINNYSEGAEGVISDILKFPSEVIDFGEDLQRKIENFGSRFAGDVAEQGAGIRGAQIGEKIANFMYKYKEELAIGGLIAGLIFLTRK